MSEFSPLYPVRYSLALVDLISIIGFTLSEVLAIANSKDTQSHARWMISTVFWVLSPGTVRFSLILFWAIFQPKEFSDFPFEWKVVFIWNQVLIMLIILYLLIKDYRKLMKIYLSYALTLIATILFIPIIAGLRDASWPSCFFD